MSGTPVPYNTPMTDKQNLPTLAWSAFFRKLIADIKSASAGTGTGGVAATIVGTIGVPQLISAAGGIGFTGTATQNVWFVKGSGGPITITATPAIANGTVTGQELSIVGCDDVNTITITHSVGQVSLNGDVTLGKEDEIRLRWNGSYWSEMYRRR